MMAQVGLALDNLEAVLEMAGRGLRDVVRLNYFTTDVTALFAEWGTQADLQTAHRVIEVQGNVFALLEDLLSKSAIQIDEHKES